MPLNNPRTFGLSSPLILEVSQSSRKQGKVDALGTSVLLGSFARTFGFWLKNSVKNLKPGVLKYTLFTKSGAKKE